MSYGVLAANLPAATVTALGSYAQGITASEVYVQDRRPTVPADTAYAWWRLDDDDEVQALGQIVTRLEFELRLVYQDGTRGNLETWRAAIRQALHGARLPAISGLIAVEVGSVTSEDDEELEGDVEIVVPVSFVIDLLPSYFAPAEDLAAVDGTDGTADLTWTSPPAVGDLVEFVLRRAAGATAPAAVDAGTGVTLGTPLATSVTDTTGPGQFSYALFAGYDTTGDGSADTYSAADTATVTVSTNPLGIWPSNAQGYFRADLGVTGDPVSAWANQGLAGGSLVQATGSRQPAFSAGSVGGQDGIQFDGTADVLVDASWAGPTSNPAAILLVFQPAGLSGIDAIAAIGQSTGQHFQLSLIDDTPDQGFANVSTGPGNSNAFTGDAYTAGGVNVMWAYDDGVTTTIRVNDGNDGTGASGSWSSAGQIGVGAFPNLQQFFNGTVAEAVFLDKVPTSDELADYVAYVNDRYGTAF